MNFFRRRPKPEGTPIKESLPRFTLAPGDDASLQVQTADGRREFTLNPTVTPVVEPVPPAPAPPAVASAPPQLLPQPIDPRFAVQVQTTRPEFELRAGKPEDIEIGNIQSNPEGVRRVNPLRPAPRPAPPSVGIPKVMETLTEPAVIVPPPVLVAAEVAPSVTLLPATDEGEAPVSQPVLMPPPVSPNPPPRPNPLTQKPVPQVAPVVAVPVNGAAAQPSAPTVPNSDRYMMVPGRRLARPAYRIKPIISVQGVKKIYQMGDIEVQALRGLDIDLYSGEIIAIMGPSGSGKSTLMNVLGCLDVPSEGTYLLDGVDVRQLNDDKLAEIRSQKIGFVFQSFNLLSRTTALANVELPLIYNGVRGRERHKRAAEALELVGLGNRLDHHPNELSGGQQQRVAIARSLINRPSIILADEPTGNLDSKTRAEIMQLFQRLNRDQGITIAFVTHDPETAEYCQRVVFIRDGLIARDEYREVTVGIYSNGNGAAHMAEPEVAPIISHSVADSQPSEESPPVDDILYEPSPSSVQPSQVEQRVAPPEPAKQAVIEYPIL